LNRDARRAGREQPPRPPGKIASLIGAARQPVPEVSHQVRRRAGRIGFLAGVATFFGLGLVARAVLTAPYFLLGKPAWINWLSWMLLMLGLACAVIVGRATRRSTLVRGMTERRDGPREDGSEPRLSGPHSAGSPSA